MDQHIDPRGQHRSVDDDAVPAMEETMTDTTRGISPRIGSRLRAGGQLQGQDEESEPAVEAEMSDETMCERCGHGPGCGAGRCLCRPSSSPTVPAPETVEAQDGPLIERKCAVCGREVTASSGEWWLPEQILHADGENNGRDHRAVYVREWQAAAIRAPLEERITNIQREMDETYDDLGRSNEVVKHWRARAEAAEERIRELENRAESVAQLASFNLELGERNAKLREALHDTAIRLDADARGYYMRCEICDTETDCGGEVNFTLAEHSPDCLLATSSTEATEEVGG